MGEACLQLPLTHSPKPGRCARLEPGRVSQDLAGIQIRGDGRDPFVSGFDGEIAAVYRARSAQSRPVSFESQRRNMSCSPFDLRDYFFGELPEQDRRQMDLHTKGCAA